MNKKIYIIPETKVSEFKAQMMCLSIEDGWATDDPALAPRRKEEQAKSEWGDLWSEE